MKFDQKFQFFFKKNLVGLVVLCCHTTGSSLVTTLKGPHTYPVPSSFWFARFTFYHFVGSADMCLGHTPGRIQSLPLHLVSLPLPYSISLSCSAFRNQIHVYIFTVYPGLSLKLQEPRGDWKCLCKQQMGQEASRQSWKPLPCHLIVPTDFYLLSHLFIPYPLLRRSLPLCWDGTGVFDPLTLKPSLPAISLTSCRAYLWVTAGIVRCAAYWLLPLAGLIQQN